MSQIRKIWVCPGVYWVHVGGADLRLLCGCPADVVKHLIKRGLIRPDEVEGVQCETGPNAILLPDVPLQQGQITALAEFPILQMLYRQGLLIPGHPNNTGRRPILIGSPDQIAAQTEYVFRGNYGLTSVEELIEAGVPQARAAAYHRVKLAFAFGKIERPDQLLDCRKLENEPIEIQNSVYIQRVGLNRFEIIYAGECVEVDLTLAEGMEYAAPYPLSYHAIEREYFAVLHSGNGDGWDVDQPCMASVLMFQGRIYLVDAGPSLDHILKALGIGASEVEGIFHTHCHDDHFAGLVSLVRSDKKVKYYTVPHVRAAVAKKLSALLHIPEGQFEHYFDVVDLVEGEWNDVDGLEVRPVYSPHPVENAMFRFRALAEDGYRTYAHYADMASFDVLEKLTQNTTACGDGAPAMDPAWMAQVKADYLEAADLKKLDVGGGMIHGEAQDFREDVSQKIILSHRPGPLSPSERVIGSGAPFGTVDVMIPAHQQFLRRDARTYLASYFPQLDDHDLGPLLNNELISLNPETNFIQAGEDVRHVYVLLTGEVERTDERTGAVSRFTAGSLVADFPALHGRRSQATYRARTFVRALRIDRRLYAEFIRRNNLFGEVSLLFENRDILQDSWLFSDSIGYTVQSRLSKAMTVRDIEAGSTMQDGATDGVFILQSGCLRRMMGGGPPQLLSPGDVFGEEVSIFGEPNLADARVEVLADARVYRIDPERALDVPVVRIKLFEAYSRRREAGGLERDDVAGCAAGTRTVAVGG